MNRIYIVTIGQTRRLVRAAHRAQALRHVATDSIKVDLAGQDALVECVAAGIKVEEAKAAADDEQE